MESESLRGVGGEGMISPPRHYSIPDSQLNGVTKINLEKEAVSSLSSFESLCFTGLLAAMTCQCHGAQDDEVICHSLVSVSYSPILAAGKTKSNACLAIQLFGPGSAASQGRNRI